MNDAKHGTYYSKRNPVPALTHALVPVVDLPFVLHIHVARSIVITNVVAIIITSSIRDIIMGLQSRISLMSSSIDGRNSMNVLFWMESVREMRQNSGPTIATLLIVVIFWGGISIIVIAAVLADIMDTIIFGHGAAAAVVATVIINPHFSASIVIDKFITCFCENGLKTAEG